VREDGVAGLTLAEIAIAFEEIARIGNQEVKRRLLAETLSRCDGREAVYLIKIILGDMRTGVSAGVIEMAIAEAFDVKLAAVRKARLLVADLDAVAELALAGRLEHAAFRPFVPLGYMLAQPVMTAAEIVEALAGRGAVAEDKYDGIRAQLHVADGEDGAVRVELYSRGSGSVTTSFPDLAGPAGVFAKRTGRRFVLDGEIVPMRVGANGELETLPFSILQKRLGRKVLSAGQLRANPVVFLAFDCLWLDGELLLETAFGERRGKLKELAGLRVKGETPFVIGPSEEVTTSEAMEALFAKARGRRNEGLVVKRLDSFYTPGRRGDAWMKLKSHLPTLDVVVVAAERGHGKRRDVLSDVTFSVRGEGEDLLTIGKAYSGLTDVEIAGLTQRFMEETLEERGRFRTVRPTVVLEVAFDQITKSERHSSGFAMRFPRIVRIRDDKGVGEIDTIGRVREIFSSADNLAVELEGEKRAEDTSGGQMSLF
jgi:DNA ligase-1